MKISDFLMEKNICNFRPKNYEQFYKMQKKLICDKCGIGKIVYKPIPYDGTVICSELFFNDGFFYYCGIF